MNNRAAQLIRLIVFLISISVLAACGTSAENDAGTVVENYFQAIVNGDEDRIATLSCAEWENSARADVAAFYGVKARLEGVTCQAVETGEPARDDSAIVECSGAIIATYNNEDSSFELTGKRFNVINQGGEWLVCGYAE